jgi:hypothetical protein
MTWTPAQMVWAGVLAALYLAFFLWYGGARAPLTAAEGKVLLDRMEANRAGRATAHPDLRGNFEALIAKDDGREFVMVNLETHKAGPEAKAADAAYARTVLPLLLKRGSFPVFVGTPVGPVFGTLGSRVQRVALVRYRSLRDLLDMNADPAMARGGAEKFAALEETQVFAARPVFSAFQVRLTVALIFLVVGAIGWRFLR